MPAQAGIQFWP